MSKRKIPLETKHYYHIFNRGANKAVVFKDSNDYKRFIISVKELNTKQTIGSLYELKIRRKKGIKDIITTKDKLVDIICYNLVSNHEHFILKQLQNNGISKFMHKLETGYAMYFNHKYKRSGSLFQGPFQSIPIRSETQLCWLSAYVNCNIEIHKIAQADKWIWSSYLDYIGKRNGTLCQKDIVLTNFQNIKEYIKYCREVIKEAQEIKRVEKEESV